MKWFSRNKNGKKAEKIHEKLESFRTRYDEDMRNVRHEQEILTKKNEFCPNLKILKFLENMIQPLHKIDLKGWKQIASEIAEKFREDTAEQRNLNRKYGHDYANIETMTDKVDLDALARNLERLRESWQYINDNQGNQKKDVQKKYEYIVKILDDIHESSEYLKKGFEALDKVIKSRQDKVLEDSWTDHNP